MDVIGTQAIAPIVFEEIKLGKKDRRMNSYSFSGLTQHH